MRPVAETRQVWRVGNSWYRTRYAAYYQAAKRLVLAKYPVLIHGETGPIDDDVIASVLGDGWTADLVEARREKAQRLYWQHEHGHGYAHFHPEKWQRFVRRVARFLRWVDGRREAA